jgi:colanic acid biosynthesis glycosyl transferase WcaI
LANDKPDDTFMRRLIFLNRFFTPDHSATSQLLADVTSDLAAAGYEVHVVASQQLYDDPKVRLPAHSFIKGVEVHRLATTRFGRSRLTGRAIDYLSFYLSAWRMLRQLMQRHDIVVAMTDPPLLSLIAMGLVQRRGARLVNWLQDLYPEVATALNVPLLHGSLLRRITALRDRSLKVAAANVVVGRLMADQVAARGVARDRIHVIANWSDDASIVPVAPGDNLLRRQWGLKGKFVVGYSGNLGRAHEFDTVAAAAEQLQSNPDIVFLCIGGGHQMGQLEQRVRERGLSNFQLRDYQDQSVLQLSLAVADVHWVSLRPELEGLIVPSKVYGIAAAGRPILAICASDGEIATLVERHQCGFVVAPGAVKSLVEVIFRLSKDPQLCKRLGRRARAMLDANFTRHQALQRWRSLLQDLDAFRENTSVIEQRSKRGRLTANPGARFERVCFGFVA